MTRGQDIGEKFPDSGSRAELSFLVPLQDAAVKVGEPHRFSVQGEPKVYKDYN